MRFLAKSAFYPHIRYAFCPQIRGSSPNPRFIPISAPRFIRSAPSIRPSVRFAFYPNPYLSTMLVLRITHIISYDTHSTTSVVVYLVVFLTDYLNII